MYRQLRGSRKRVRIGDVDKAPRIYTDNINQMCLVRCKLCSRQGPHFTTIQQCCGTGYGTGYGTGCGKNLPYCCSTSTRVPAANKKVLNNFVQKITKISTKYFFLLL